MIKKSTLLSYSPFIILAILFSAASIYLFEAPIGVSLAAIVGIITLLTPVILKRPEFGLAMIGFFLPFERIPSLELGGMTLKINHFLVIYVFIVFLISALAQKKLVIPKDPIRAYLLIFILSLSLSLPAAVSLNRAIQMIALMLLMYILYLTVTLMISNKKILILVLKGVLWGATIMAFLGIFQFLGDKIGLPTTITLLRPGYDKSTFGFARVQALSQEPLYFANYIFLPLMLGLVLSLRGKLERVFNRRLGVIVMALLAINFLIAISRGAYLGAAVVVLILLITQAKLIFKAKTMAAIIVVGVVVFGGVYLALAKSESRALDEFIGHVAVQDREEGESVVSRLNASTQALQLFQSNFLFGVGSGNFGPRVQGDPDDVPEGGWFIVNNEYLEILAENGIVGLMAFVILLVAVFARALFAINQSKDALFRGILIGLTLALVGILVQYATFSTLYIFHIWFTVGLIGAVSNIILNKEPKVAK